MSQPRPAHPTRHVVAALRDDFVCGRMIPDQALPILELSARFGLSATPVREALARLAGEGLVVIAAGGHACASLGPPELSQLRRLERLLLGSLVGGVCGAAADLEHRFRARASERASEVADTQWLMEEMARGEGEAVVLDALGRLGARLGVVRRVEGVSLEELHGMAVAFSRGGDAWCETLDRYFARRRGREAVTIDAVRRLSIRPNPH